MVRKKSLWKNIYREILRSPGRFLAILGIILLGTGFFVGLRVTRDAMVRTVNTYLERASFYDFALSSTLGYTEEEAEGFLGADFVEQAEGSHRRDALVALSTEEDEVLSFLSLPSRLNLVDVVEGRMPEKAGECLADMGLADIAVGDVLRLSDENDEDTAEEFRVREFTVVGRARSPLYLNYERGATSLGSGSIAGFLYVPYETFDVDYFSTVYLRLTDMGDAYSAAYDDRADTLEPEVIELAESLAHDRYETLYREAEEELADGEKEYADGVKEYEEERAEAEEELADAKKELDDARKELNDAVTKITDGRRELEDKRTEGAAEIADAEKKLADAKKELDDGEAEYAEGYQEYANAEAEYAKGEQEYKSGLSKYEDGLNQYQAGLAAYEAGKTQLESGIAQCKTGIAQVDGGIGEAEQGLAALQQALDGMAALPDDDPAKAALITQKQTTEATLAGLRQQRAALAAQLQELETQQAALPAEEQKLAAAKAQLDATEPQLREASGTLNFTRFLLDGTKDKLAKARKELDDGQAEYAKGLADLEKAKNDYNTGIADAEKELADAQKKLADGEKEYADGIKEYEDAKKEADEEFAKAEQELADARQELDDAADDLARFTGPDVYVLGRYANIGYACYDNDSAIVQSISTVFPLFFFLVAALICMTTVKRMVDEQRGQTGVLTALGYSERDTMLKYMVYAGSATALGGILGVVIGSFAIPQVLWLAYSIMYTYAEHLEYYINVPLSLVTFAAYLLAMLAVTYASLRATLKEVPAQMLRPKPPKAGKRVLLEHVGFLWHRLSFMWKVTMRNIFRYKERVLMMVLGVAGCTALMVTGFGIRDSISNIVEYQYDEITLYDYDLLFSEGLSGSDRETFLANTGLSGEDVLFAHQESATAQNARNEKNVYLTVIPEEDQIGNFLSLKTGKETLSYPGDGEVLINTGLAAALHLSAGDTLTLRTDTRVHTFTVSGVFDNYIYNYVYMNADTYRSAEKKDAEIKVAYVRAPEGAGDLTSLLLQEENVLNVTAGSLLKERIGAIMDNMIYVVLLTIVCAAMLAFIVIYNLTNININERIREIATVKVLGFYPGETAGYVLRENILLTMLGALLGVPLGIALNTYVMNMIRVDLVYFTPRILPVSFLYGILLTALFGLAVDCVMAVKLNRINEAVALKAAE